MAAIMQFKNLIKTEITASINTKLAVQDALLAQIVQAGELLAQTLQTGNKVLCCGNGGSASDAEHFAAELVGRYVSERRSLPGIALTANTSSITAIGNDYGYEQVFARQIQGLGNAGDVLVVITTSGNSANLIHAVNTARQKKLKIIALTGKGGGKLAQLLHADKDIHLCIPSDKTSRIQEAHIMLIHCWCEIIDAKLN